MAWRTLSARKNASLPTTSPTKASNKPARRSACSSTLCDGQYEGKGLSHPEIRAYFDRDSILASEWYQERLQTKQEVDIAQWQRHTAYLTRFLEQANYANEANRLGIADRLTKAQAELERVKSPDYLAALTGTIGAEPAIRK